MQFILADTFSTSLAKLQNDEQKQAKLTAMELQLNSANPGLQFHRVNKSKDQNFWSIRVSRDLRIIVHKTQSSFMVCYVAHHDDAYDWAERRRVEVHPRTGVIQIAQVRERIEEIVVANDEPIADASQGPPIFDPLTNYELLDVGVPEDWLADIRCASETSFLEIYDHLPAEAAEALLLFASDGVLPTKTSDEVYENPYLHPDAQRRFRVLDDVEELQKAMEFPWEKWVLYLHPAQRQVVDRVFSGPARVAGSAGTGKTVVALHRAANALIAEPDAKLLLTTFSRPLSNMLNHKLAILLADHLGAKTNATVLSFQDTARDLFTLIQGYPHRLARPQDIDDALEKSMQGLGTGEFTRRFVQSEWKNVVDAWQITDLESYASVSRIGRKHRLGSQQRERLWPVFADIRKILLRNGRMTWPMVFDLVANHYQAREHKPFTHIVVDEAQDVGVPELRMLSAICVEQPNALFFAGDLGQRIFQEPFSWKAQGVDVRGRSTTLKVNYRTSHQIRETVDRLLPDHLRDVDGVEEDRRGTVSVFNGAVPQILNNETEADEIAAVADVIKNLADIGLSAENIGIFVRSNAQLPRARAAVSAASLSIQELSERIEDADGGIRIGTMHLAKGLEFRAVIVMACDDEVLPDQQRIEEASDENELEEIFESERHLFYVACTRARDHLYVSSVSPGSEYIEDLLDG